MFSCSLQCAWAVFFFFFQQARLVLKQPLLGMRAVVLENSTSCCFGPARLAPASSHAHASNTGVSLVSLFPFPHCVPPHHQMTIHGPASSSNC